MGKVKEHFANQQILDMLFYRRNERSAWSEQKLRKKGRFENLFLSQGYLLKGGKTMSIIGATIFNIDATMIYIVFTKIGVVCVGVKKVRSSEVLKV